MKTTFSLFILTLLLMACEEGTKKINHDDLSKQELKKDSLEIETADLPIIIDSTDYLIHPIGYIKEYSSRYFSESSQTSYSISNYNSHSIRGEFSNLKFQHKNDSDLKPLFNKVVKISSVNFLHKIKENTGLNYLVYKVRDIDTNGDLKLNYSDVTTLYISNIDGSNLKKLTKDFDQIVDWKTIPELNRLYLKSISDTNKNGDFDKEDRITYAYVDLTNPTLKRIVYNPVN